MKKSNIGLLTPGGLIGLGVSAVLILLAFFLFGNQIFSPGDLNQQSSGRILGGAASHADLAKDCKACHPAPWSISGQNMLCLDCHQDVTRQLTDPTTLHGAVWSGDPKSNCNDCHTEHLGPDGALTNYGGEDFPHQLVGFSLASHTKVDWDRELTCQDCHPASLSRFELRSCQVCHQQIDRAFIEVHFQDYGDQCLACHDGLETITKRYPHDQGKFFLTGAHQQTSCASCHAESTSLTDFKQASPACLSCHAKDDIHQSELGDACQECHTPTGWIPSIFDHQSTGFPLTFGHAGLACSDCHGDLTFQKAEPVCFSCHEADDPHMGLLGNSCQNCHSIISWGDVSFDHTAPSTQYCSACHLDEKPQNHYQGECSACHQTTAWLPAYFDHAAAGAVDCQSCHLPDKPANHYPGQCSFCHGTSSWLPAFFSHTFPLNHGGAGSNCSRCHTTSNYASYTCYQCHEHNRTDIRKEHEGVSNLENCVRCHWDGRKHEGGGED